MFKVLPGGNHLGYAITGFLFAAHPIHSEAVAGVVGRADLLACLLTLTSLLAYSAHCDQTRTPLPLFLALVSSILATLAKETGISSLALCLLWELCRGEPNRKVGYLFIMFNGIFSTCCFDERVKFNSLLRILLYVRLMYYMNYKYMN